MQNATWFVVGCCLAPNRIKPFPDNFVVGATQQPCGGFSITSEMGGNRLAKTMRGRLDFRNWFPQASAKAHSDSGRLHDLGVSLLALTKDERLPA
jgi:hypothetical protein